MKTKLFLLLLACCSLICGCKKPERIQWQYKTLVIYDDELNSSKPDDNNCFSKIDIQKELKTFSLGDEYSSEWEICGCFLEPKKDPRLIVLLKRQY